MWGRIRRLIGDSATPADENRAARDTVLFTLEGEIAQTYFLIRYGDEELRMLDESIELRKPALYATTKSAEEPESRSEPQPQENGEQHTSRDWQRPASETV